MSIIISDICGTLVRENTTRAFLAWMAERGYRTREIRAALSRPVSWISVRSGRDLSRRWLIWALRGYDRALLNSEAHAYVDQALVMRGRASLLEDLRRNANTGGILVLASATLDPIARAFQDNLGARSAVSSRLAYDEHQCCLGRLESDLTGRKWQAVERIISAAQREEIVLHTDNNEDLDLMRHSGHTVFYGVPASATKQEIAPGRLTVMAADSP